MSAPSADREEDVVAAVDGIVDLHADGSAAGSGRDEAQGPGGGWFWSGLIVGGAIMAWAVHGAFVDADATRPPLLAGWVLGAAVVHDAVVAPVATVVALLVAWRLPVWWGRPVAAALAGSALLLLFAYPLLRGFGLRPGNPSALPRDYGTAAVALLAALWLGAVFVVVTRAIRRRRSA